MKKILLWSKLRSLKIARLFGHTDRNSELKLFGLGQFVLLLTLTPFIFDLSLYSLGKPVPVPSYYAYDANRFVPLPEIPRRPKEPIKPQKQPPLTLLEVLVNGGNLPFNLFPIYNKELAAFKAQEQQYNTAKSIYDYEQQVYDNALQKHEQLHQILDSHNASSLATLKPKGQVHIMDKKTRSFELVFNSQGNELRLILILLLFALLIIPTLWLSVRRQYWGFLVFGLSIPFAILIDVFVVSLPVIFTIVVPKIAFSWFAVRGQIRSKSFALFILLIAFSVGLLPTLVFLTVATIARLFVKGARENAYLLKKLGWSKSIRTVLRSLVLWLPMAVLAIPYLYFTEVSFPKATINNLHKNNLLQYGYGHDVLDNLLQSAALKSDDLMFAWFVKMESLKSDIQTNSNKIGQNGLENRVMEAFDNIVPDQLEFDEYHSDAWLIGGAIETGVEAGQDLTNKAAVKFREKTKDNVRKFAQKHEAEFQAQLNGRTQDALAVLQKIDTQGRNLISEQNKDTQTAIWWTMIYLNAAHQLSLLFFAFVCVKSFIYVFARVSFNRETNVFVTLGNTRETVTNHTQSLIRSTGLEYLINSDKDEKFFISRRFQCRGKAPKFSIPQPFYAPIARLLHGAYTMNKVEIHQGDDPVSCTATKGIEFFEWDLATGETVILDFHYFVGMSESVQVSTLISPRISSLLLGKMIFSQATGPGKLILMAEGRAEIVDSQVATSSLPPERMLAMHKDTRLHIDSELDIVNVYLSTAYIRPAGNGKVIVDVDSQRGSKAGLGSFIKHFLLPV